MDFEAVAKFVLDQFKARHIRYALIGGFALQAAGFARATNDIDFLVHVDDVGVVKKILVDFGYEIAHESADVVNFWGKLKQLGGLDFIIAHRKYALAMLKRAKSHEFLNHSVSVAVPEDIIGLKLQAIANDASRQAQDMADIEWLIKNHRQSLDMNLLQEYFGVFNKEFELKRILENGNA